MNDKESSSVLRLVGLLTLILRFLFMMIALFVGIASVSWVINELAHLWR